jgi:hypothetical protein
MILWLLSCFLLNFQATSPVLWVSSQNYELGEVLHREPKTIYYKFKNITKKPILVDNVRADCGCTTPFWPDSPILPDSVGAITVKYNAWNKGNFDKKIKVFFHSFDKPEVLHLKGKVVKEFDEDE